MFSSIGKIHSKSSVVQGESINGRWRVMNFGFVKQFNKKKTNVVFTVRGSMVDKLQKIKKGEKVRVEFYPQSNFFKDRVFTELIVVSIEKYIPKPKITASNESPCLNIINENDFNFTPDNELPFQPIIKNKK